MEFKDYEEFRRSIEREIGTYGVTCLSKFVLKAVDQAWMIGEQCGYDCGVEIGHRDAKKLKGSKDA